MYIPTVEAYFNKVEKVDNKTYEICILDTSGTEEWATLQVEYMNNKDAVILVYSVDKKDHLKDIEKVYQELRFNNEDIPIVLIANKIDLPRRKITTEEGKALAGKMKCPYFEVSAKLNKNINEVFFDLIRTVSEMKRMQMSKRTSISSENIQTESEIKGWSQWLFSYCCMV